MVYLYCCLMIYLVILYFFIENKATDDIKHSPNKFLEESNASNILNASNTSNTSNSSYKTIATLSKKTSNKLGKYFNKKDLKRFNKKYGEHAKTYTFKYGQITITPSKYVEEIPQISWNGYFINNLLVYPKYRGNGYGQRLLKYIIKHTRDSGALHLISQVDKTNISAIRTHESAGFGRHEDGYTTDGREVIIFIYNL